MMLRTGGFKPNEVRRLEDMPPDKSPNADKLWISGDLYPIDMDPTLRKASKGGESGGKEEK